MRTCKVLIISRLEQILANSLNEEEKPIYEKGSEEEFKTIYEENCKFHKWVDYPYTKKESAFGKYYVTSVREEPHGLIEHADGHMDLIHYSKIVFTDGK